jgi:hypothetical protein
VHGACRCWPLTRARMNHAPPGVHGAWPTCAPAGWLGGHVPLLAHPPRAQEPCCWVWGWAHRASGFLGGRGGGEGMHPTWPADVHGACRRWPSTRARRRQGPPAVHGACRCWPLTRARRNHAPPGVHGGWMGGRAHLVGALGCRRAGVHLTLIIKRREANGLHRAQGPAGQSLRMFLCSGRHFCKLFARQRVGLRARRRVGLWRVLVGGFQRDELGVGGGRKVSSIACELPVMSLTFISNNSTGAEQSWRGHANKSGCFETFADLPVSRVNCQLFVQHLNPLYYFRCRTFDNRGEGTQINPVVFQTFADLPVSRVNCQYLFNTCIHYIISDAEPPTIVEKERI